MWALLINLDNFGNPNCKIEFFLRVKISVSTVKVLKVVRVINLSINFVNCSLQEKFHGLLDQKMHHLCVSEGFRQVFSEHCAQCVMTGVGVCLSVSEKQLSCRVIVDVIVNNGVFRFMVSHHKPPSRNDEGLNTVVAVLSS